MRDFKTINEGKILAKRKQYRRVKIHQKPHSAILKQEISIDLQSVVFKKKKKRKKMKPNALK